MKYMVNLKDSSDGKKIVSKTVLLVENREFVNRIYETISCSSYVDNYQNIMRLCYGFQYFNDYMLMAQSTWYLLQTIYLANLTLCNFGVLSRDEHFCISSIDPSKLRLSSYWEPIFRNHIYIFLGWLAPIPVLAVAIYMNNPEDPDESFHYIRMISGCHGKYSDEHFGQIDEQKHTVYYERIH